MVKTTAVPRLCVCNTRRATASMGKLRPGLQIIRHPKSSKKSSELVPWIIYNEMVIVMYATFVKQVITLKVLTKSSSESQHKRNPL